jgi:ABC-type Mn2+/Zn2+ transport system ATPase subunit
MPLNKQLLDEVFVICEFIEVEVSVLIITHNIKLNYAAWTTFICLKETQKYSKHEVPESQNIIKTPLTCLLFRKTSQHN